jgi:hypothetical protein
LSVIAATIDKKKCREKGVEGKGKKERSAQISVLVVRITFLTPRNLGEGIT